MQDALERKQRDRKTASGRHPEPGPQAQQKYLRLLQRYEQPHRGRCKACCWPGSGGRVLTVICRPTSAASRPSAWCDASVSPPTPSRVALWLILTAMWSTTGGNQHRARQLQLDAGAEGVMASPCWAKTCKSSIPSALAGQSDTATFDVKLAWTAMTSGSMPHQPGRDDDDSEPWEQHEPWTSVAAPHEYHAAMIEALDGSLPHRSHRWSPDRRYAGPQRSAPSRYCITDDDMVILAS